MTVSEIRVERCRTAHYRLPREVWWPRPLRDHTLTIDAIDLVTCEVETGDGVHGSGYTYVLGSGGAAVHAMLAEDIAPVLETLELRHPEGVWRELWQRLYRVGRAGVVPVALAAADVALWDALAKTDGLPLYRYLGALRESVPVYGSSIDLGWSEEELVATARGWVERGFGAVKVKVGRTPREDLARLQAVREAIGPDVALMVDANCGWDLPEAARRAALMERFDLAWLEEPLAPEDLEGHARLQAQTPIPIAAGETLFSAYEFSAYMRAGALRYAQADVARLGGITPWLRVATLAEAQHLPMVPHFVQDVHVHLLCAIPNAFMLEYLPLLDGLLERPLEVVGGHARPPDEPGTGVRFRADVLEAHRVR
jgi:L-alanine-DL-glutamate epimerase-like enolase superfamily enzyme